MISKRPFGLSTASGYVYAHWVINKSNDNDNKITIIIALTKKLLSDRYYSWHLDMFNHWIFKKIPTMVDRIFPVSLMRHPRQSAFGLTLTGPVKG